MPENSEGITVDPGAIRIKEFLEKQSDRVSIAQGSYEFKPHQLVLGKTLEYVILPNHLAARIEGKSSLARFGLSVHFTAPTVMAGFEGHLVLEMYNSGPFTIKLSHRMKNRATYPRIGLASITPRLQWSIPETEIGARRERQGQHVDTPCSRTGSTLARQQSAHDGPDAGRDGRQAPHLSPVDRHLSATLANLSRFKGRRATSCLWLPLGTSFWRWLMKDKLC